MGICTAIAIGLCFFCSTQVMSQTSAEKTSPFETEESIRERQRWFYDMRRNAGGIIDEFGGCFRGLLRTRKSKRVCPDHENLAYAVMKCQENWLE